ncbi:tRNA uridine-5-carboxymethylaminomethyl(34) synthesis GTPase MnmE [Thermocrinis sp.]
MKQREPIVAIATPYGESAIGVVRLSGLGVLEKVLPFVKVKGKVKERYAHFVSLFDENGEQIDEGIMIYYKAPKSYTGEDMVELFLHGNPLILKRVVEMFLKNGVRMAQRGEFTKRAFLNGKIDLLQAEAVGDLIGARSELALRSALRQLRGELSEFIKPLREKLMNLCAFVEASIEFEEQDIPTLSGQEIIQILKDISAKIDKLLSTVKTGEFLRKGLNLAIVGKPNVGKSSLFNILLGTQRAIVTDVPGTTRDFLQEPLNLEGIPINLIDTAGIRHSLDPVERIGIQRSIEKLNSAHLILFVAQAHEPLQEEDLYIYSLVKDKNHVVVLNKVDLGFWEGHKEMFKNFVTVSAKSGEGLQELKNLILEAVGRNVGEGLYISIRHADLLQKSSEVIKLVIDKINKEDVSPEILMLYLREAQSYLDEMIGEITTEEILEEIFSNFCIGK